MATLNTRKSHKIRGKFW